MKKNPGEAPEGFWNVGGVEWWISGSKIGEEMLYSSLFINYFNMLDLNSDSWLLTPDYFLHALCLAPCTFLI